MFLTLCDNSSFDVLINFVLIKKEKCTTSLLFNFSAPISARENVFISGYPPVCFEYRDTSEGKIDGKT